MQPESLIYESPLGRIRIEAKGNAISAVSFLDDDNSVNSETVTQPVVAECIKQLEAYFNGTLKRFSFPLQLEGTEFQLRVWNALLNIDFASTISYHRLSMLTGNVKAIRAVGLSNGKNPVAIIVPCHRVIGSDGSLIGYSGKLWRKQWLLEHEMNVISQQLKLAF